MRDRSPFSRVTTGMSDESRSPTLTLRIVYEDLPDFIKVEAWVVVGRWSGVSWAYTDPDSLVEEALGLQAWLVRPSGEHTLEAGSVDLRRLVLAALMRRPRGPSGLSDPDRGGRARWLGRGNATPLLGVSCGAGSGRAIRPSVGSSRPVAVRRSRHGRHLSSTH